MTFLFNVLLVLHFIGLASLLGGFIVQMKSADKGVNPAMWHGALTQVVTGVLMYGMLEAKVLGDDEPVPSAKFGIKLLIAIVIAVLAFVGRKRTPPQVGLWGAIGGLTLVNILIAVFWG